LSAFLASAVARFIAGLAHLVTGVSADWRGCAPEPKQRVYFANHSSHGDFVLIWTVLPPDLRQMTRPVAAADYWSGAGLRRFLGTQVFRSVLIERQSSSGPGAALTSMMAALHTGSSLIIFPEGTRNTGDEPLLPLHAGIYYLAERFPSAEFVPVWINNISRVMPKGEFLPIPLLCSVTFGAPIALLPTEGRHAFLARAREALLALKPNELAA
jgi:1-acyl-sn-glycerol-3-phosphate acyltransferase